MDAQAMPDAIRPKSAPPPDVQMAVAAWNLMGGIDWLALDAVAEMLGITDLETLITQLVTIRDANQDA